MYNMLLVLLLILFLLCGRLRYLRVDDAISIEAILHAGHQGKLCAGPKKEEVIFKDPLDILPHVYLVFPPWFIILRKDQRAGSHEGPRKGPLVPSEGDGGCKEPGKEKIREKKHEGPDRVEPYFGLCLYYASVLAHGIFSA